MSQTCYALGMTTKQATDLVVGDKIVWMGGTGVITEVEHTHDPNDGHLIVIFTRIKLTPRMPGQAETEVVCWDPPDMVNLR